MLRDFGHISTVPAEIDIVFRYGENSLRVPPRLGCKNSVAPHTTAENERLSASGSAGPLLPWAEFGIMALGDQKAGLRRGQRRCAEKGDDSRSAALKVAQSRKSGN